MLEVSMKLKILPSLAACLLAATPSLAQEDISFKPIPTRDIVIAPLTDAYVQDLIATFDSLLAREKDPDKWLAAARTHFWRFTNRLDQGLVNDAQEARILQYLDGLAAKNPAGAEYLRTQATGIRSRRVGKVTPDIVGKDLDGVEFKLSDYRGKVVVLYFSGDWCGPCRSEYPYQRLMLELYKDQPFTILSVNSDTLDVAKKAKAEKNLNYRSWWDGNQKETTKGPIATGWNVVGWPTIYLIDHTGTIRFVNLRAEDVLKGAKQLMREVPKPATNSQ
jgi:peroxiredoxin